GASRDGHHELLWSGRPESDVQLWSRAGCARPHLAPHRSRWREGLRPDGVGVRSRFRVQAAVRIPAGRRQPAVSEGIPGSSPYAVRRYVLVRLRIRIRRTTMKRTRRFAWVLAASASLLTGCYSFSSYQTARLVPPNVVELTPSVSRFQPTFEN